MNAERQRGVALITTLAIVVVVAILVFGSVLTTQLEITLTRNDLATAQAQYVAQAGLQTYKASLFQTYRYILATGGSIADPCATSLDLEIDFTRGFGDAAVWQNDVINLSSLMGVRTPVEGSGGDLVGVFEISLLRDPNRSSYITIRSRGYATSDRSNVEATNAPTNVRAASTATTTFNLSTGSTIEQAIFAGAGSGMRSINGNARIFGGVYIEGDRLLYETTGAEPSVFDTSGTFAMFNAYDANTFDQGVYQPTRLINNPVEPNLCASMRVGYGSITIAGSASLGTPEDPLYSVAVGQSSGNVIYSGEPIEGDVDEFCANNKGVCSFRGVTTFDLEEPPTFPLLDEPPANADLCPGSDTWRDCITEEVGDHGLQFTPSEGLTLSNGAMPDGDTCGAFLDAAADSADNRLVFGTQSIDCTAGEPPVGFKYTVAGRRNNEVGFIETFGHVNLRGLDVVFALPTEYRASSNTGPLAENASFSVFADGNVGGNILVNEDFVPHETLTSGQYPDNVLALVGEGIVSLNGGQATYVTAPIYAGTLMQVRANSTLIGQAISNSFCSMANANSNPTAIACTAGGTPPTIIFKSAGENRPNSYRAVAEPGGTPTFELLSYEMR